uniref:Uncharacterized protein n=1 Tax=viral metagenome TaxID=1070528 RepID=A0A6C0DMG7_9ZZZZ
MSDAQIAPLPAAEEAALQQLDLTDKVTASSELVPEGTAPPAEAVPEGSTEKTEGSVEKTEDPQQKSWFPSWGGKRKTKKQSRKQKGGKKSKSRGGNKKSRKQKRSAKNKRA